MIKVRWFKNTHEQRNYWLRFGLMRLHGTGAIDYREYPIVACTDAGFSPFLAKHEHRHTSVISVEDGGKQVRCIVDCEDSFLVMDGLIEHAEVYFCAGYNASFFKDRRFSPPYAWLKPHEVETYERRAEGIVRDYGKWFERVRPFVPICPSITVGRETSLPKQKLLNAIDKTARKLRSSEPWFNSHRSFEQRYLDLLALRNAPSNYDVVLLDTLWGWPRHRLALHQRLKDLGATGFNIHARLNWCAPSPWDGSAQAPLDKALFPIATGSVVDYERMLAQSRLAVFATGFHWGWRSIMALALMLGLPMFADRLLLQPWFDMERFDISWNDDSDWSELRSALEGISNERRSRIQQHNQNVFDEFLAPEKVAEYFVATALGQDASVTQQAYGQRLMHSAAGLP